MIFRYGVVQILGDSKVYYAERLMRYSLPTKNDEGVVSNPYFTSLVVF